MLSTDTDVSGTFNLTALPNDSWQIQPQKFGGIGSAVSVLDAVYVLQAVVGQRTLTGAQTIACDVSGNGALSAFDAALILQYQVGLITSFPVAQACGSDWAFMPEPMPAMYQQVMQPVIATGSCQGGAIAFQPLVGDVNSQNFHAAVFGDCNGSWQPSGTGAAVSSGGPSSAVQLGQLRRHSRSGLFAAPLSVQGHNVHGIDLDVHYDPTHLTPRGFRRVGGARHALVAANARRPGDLAISLASIEPLESGAVLLLQFEAHDARSARSALHIMHATVEGD